MDDAPPDNATRAIPARHPRVEHRTPGALGPLPMPEFRPAAPDTPRLTPAGHVRFPEPRLPPAPTSGAIPPDALRLLEQTRSAIRMRHYSPRTEKAYLGWIRRFVAAHGGRHPDQMGLPEVSGYLAHLAVRAGVSASH